MGTAAEEAAKATVEQAGGPPGGNGDGDKDTPAEGRHVGEGRAAVERAATEKPKGLTDEEVRLGTEWYLDPDAYQDDDVTHTFNLNIAPYGKKKKLVPWTIVPLPRDRIQQIRKTYTHRRGAVETTDDMGINLALAVEATAVPDLTSPEVRGPYADPADALRLRLFPRKQGLIDQIANTVMSVSGYDDDDVVEVEAAKN